MFKNYTYESVRRYLEVRSQESLWSRITLRVRRLHSKVGASGTFKDLGSHLLYSESGVASHSEFGESQRRVTVRV